MRERFQFSIGEAALVIALCAVLLAATQTVGSKQVILQWAFSWGAGLLRQSDSLPFTRRSCAALLPEFVPHFSFSRLDDNRLVQPGHKVHEASDENDKEPYPRQENEDARP